MEQGFQFKPTNFSVRRFDVERDEQWRPLVDHMPWLKFPPSWEVRIIPPFGGAAARFLVRSISSKSTTHQVSVYFDANSALGVMNVPYWEIYPNGQDTNERFLLGEEKEMIQAISKALRAISNGKVKP